MGPTEAALEALGASNAPFGLPEQVWALWGAGAPLRVICEGAVGDRWENAAGWPTRIVGAQRVQERKAPRKKTVAPVLIVEKCLSPQDRELLARFASRFYDEFLFLRKRRQKHPHSLTGRAAFWVKEGWRTGDVHWDSVDLTMLAGNWPGEMAKKHRLQKERKGFRPAQKKAAQRVEKAWSGVAPWSRRKKGEGLVRRGEKAAKIRGQSSNLRKKRTRTPHPLPARALTPRRVGSLNVNCQERLWTPKSDWLKKRCLRYSPVTKNRRARWASELVKALFLALKKALASAGIKCWVWEPKMLSQEFHEQGGLLDLTRMLIAKKENKLLVSAMEMDAKRPVEGVATASQDGAREGTAKKTPGRRL